MELPFYWICYSTLVHPLKIWKTRNNIFNNFKEEKEIFKIIRLTGIFSAHLIVEKNMSLTFKKKSLYFRKLMKFNNTEAYIFKMVLSKIQYYLCQLEKLWACLMPLTNYFIKLIQQRIKHRLTWITKLSVRNNISCRLL